MPRDPLNHLGVVLGIFVVLSFVFQGLLACNAGLVQRVQAAPGVWAPLRPPNAPCDPALPYAVGQDTLYLPARAP